MILFNWMFVVFNHICFLASIINIVDFRNYLRKKIVDILIAKIPITSTDMEKPVLHQLKTLFINSGNNPIILLLIKIDKSDLQQ